MENCLVSIEDLSKEEILNILKRTEDFVGIAKGEKSSGLLKGKILGNLFFEPSTRTRMSFEVAMKRLGGEVVNLGSLEGSSVAKGECLKDTVLTVSQYCDIIVIRSPLEGAARFAAEISDKPIINGGDGAAQHPTQTLLDLYTLWKEVRLDGVKIAMVGDLKYSRTVHSLLKALRLFGAEIFLVSPDILELPVEMFGSDCKKVNVEEAVKKCDVVYVTRIQKERFSDLDEYNKVAGSYKITANLLELNPDIKVMHPLPRVDEIEYDVDETPSAIYFKQAFYGVPVRMAILSKLLGKW